MGKRKGKLEANSDMSDEEIFRNMAGRSAVDRFVASSSAVRAEAPPALRASHLVGEVRILYGMMHLR